MVIRVYGVFYNGYRTARFTFLQRIYHNSSWGNLAWIMKRGDNLT